MFDKRKPNMNSATHYNFHKKILHFLSGPSLKIMFFVQYHYCHFCIDQNIIYRGNRQYCQLTLYSLWAHDLQLATNFIPCVTCHKRFLGSLRPVRSTWMKWKNYVLQMQVGALWNVRVVLLCISSFFIAFFHCIFVCWIFRCYIFFCCIAWILEYQ